MKNLFIFRTFCSAKITSCYVKFRHFYSAFFKQGILNVKSVTLNTPHVMLNLFQHLTKMVSNPRFGTSLIRFRNKFGMTAAHWNASHRLGKQPAFSQFVTLNLFQGLKRSMAFSLVELLMALLVASLLMAALAPVMTKKYKESVEVYGSSSGVRMDYTKTFTKDTKWIVPNGVNYITVTSIGGGGGGGGASYGYKEITSSESNWTVPDGVTKIRVFMTGAGGGGASGGYYANFAETKGRDDGLTYANFLAAGETNFTITNRVVPALDNRCIASGTTQWTQISNNAIKYNPNDIIPVKVTGCGGGGGGGFSGAGDTGGSGGYFSDQTLSISTLVAKLTIKIGDGGKASAGNFLGGLGGSGAHPGMSGANGSGNTGNGSGGPGAGGGGSTAILDSSNNFLFEAPGGGGAGGYAGTCHNGVTAIGGNGGDGGGTNAGLGGKGSIVNGGTNQTNTVGLGGSGYVKGADAVYRPNPSAPTVCGDSSGSCGGGGINGGGGTSAAGGIVPSSIFNSSTNCSGANGGVHGKPGALRLYYTYPPLRCEYHLATNGGGGGGAGQIWIGEIDVTPGQKINFNIGLGGDGGNKDTGIGINGKDGGSTSIVVDGYTYGISGGKGGKYESDDTYIANSGGLGGGLKINDNWTDIESTNTNAGSAGLPGNTVSNNAGGGTGGGTIAKDGSILQGGSAGGMQANGIDAPSNHYGAGGGGGGGAGVGLTQNPGTGGKGANGYIYIEWGSANGGGGASGQVITEKNVLVSAGSTIEIKVGKGGSANEVLTVLNGVNGYFGQKGNDGGESYIVVPPNIEEKHGFAKGGIGGYPAGSNHGTGGNFDDSVVNSTKGQPGNDEFGGNGGNITQALCPLIEAIKGLGGCGGNLTISDSDPVNACANPSSGPVGKNAATIGGGGGGGAVKDNAAYKGGNGANGAVIIEWNN